MTPGSATPIDALKWHGLVLIGHSDFKLFMDTNGHLFEDKAANTVNAQANENSMLR